MRAAARARPRAMSLQRRLLAGMAASVLAVTGLLWLGGSHALREITMGTVERRLAQDLEALLGGIAFDDSGQPVLDQNRLTPVYAQPFSGHYFQLVIGDQIPLQSRSLWDEALPAIGVAAGKVQALHTPGPADQSLLVLAGGYVKAGRAFTLMVAADLSRLEDEIDRYQWLLAGGTLIALIVTLLLLRTVVRRTLASLDAVRADVRAVGTGNAEALRDEVPVEIQPLVREFNRLLRLLAQRLNRSRNAVGNLAHALKTPLSLVQGALREAATADDRALARAQAGNIERLIERELRRARIAGSGIAGRRFAAEQDLPALVTTLEHVHAERGVRIDAGTWPEDAAAVDREDMLELLGNLLDNACKWADGQVQLTATQDSALVIQVADDGAGVDDAMLDRLAERGTRIDETRDGHGLGLSIVRDIVEQYGGELAFGRSTGLGGLEVRVRLPRSEAG